MPSQVRISNGTVLTTTTTTRPVKSVSRQREHERNGHRDECYHQRPLMQTTTDDHSNPPPHRAVTDSDNRPSPPKSVAATDGHEQLRL